MGKNKECFDYIDDNVTTSCRGDVRVYVHQGWGGVFVKLCSGHYKEHFIDGDKS